MKKVKISAEKYFLSKVVKNGIYLCRRNYNRHAYEDNRKNHITLIISPD